MTALKVLVGAMTVLILLGLGAVIWRSFELVSGRAAGRNFGAVSLGLAAGCRIVEARPEGARLIVRAGEGGSCERVYILDIVTGAVLGTVAP